MSPGPGLRHEEDAIIVEMGSRFLRAGFEGDSTPACAVGFGREEARRVGDYRGWIKSDKSKATEPPRSVEEWSKDHELWSMDIRDLDIGLVEDKIERAFRDIYNKYILTDAGSARLVLVLPSIVPHPLLSALLSTLFHRWRYPSIMLLPSAAMAAVAAGVRSALVVDIGWEETVVTSIYEYREVKSRRSTRAMKRLVQQVGTFLSGRIQETTGSHDGDDARRDDSISVNFEQCEEITSRMSWCRKQPKPDQPSDNQSTQHDDAFGDKTISLTFPTPKGAVDTDIPFSKFADMVDDSLFAAGTEPKDWDDEDVPLDVLVYNALLSLSGDVRGVCMSRIIFVGGGSNIPGVRQRVLNDLDGLIKNLKWKVARGRVIEKQKGERQDHRQRNRSGPDAEVNGKQDTPSEPESNFIDEKLQRDDKDAKPSIHGVIRAVESLGAWAGASLAASLKVRGLVEVEREKFLQHGLAGASRDVDMHAVLERRSGYGASVVKPTGDRANWTLGEWE